LFEAALREFITLLIKDKRYIKLERTNILWVYLGAAEKVKVLKKEGRINAFSDYLI